MVSLGSEVPARMTFHRSAAPLSLTLSIDGPLSRRVCFLIFEASHKTESGICPSFSKN